MGYSLWGCKKVGHDLATTPPPPCGSLGCCRRRKRQQADVPLEWWPRETAFRQMAYI